MILLTKIDYPTRRANYLIGTSSIIVYGRSKRSLSKIVEKSFGDLMEEVVAPGLCTACGTCVAVCPFNVLILREESFIRLDLRALEVTHDTFKTIDEQCQQCGFCYYNCPEKMFNLKKAEQDEFGSVVDNELGHLRKAYEAQSCDEKILGNAQCGGVATALLKYILEKGLVEAAVGVTTMEHAAWKPIPMVITDPRNVLKVQKTKYTPASTIIGVESALFEWAKSKIAVVATPCQIRGLWTIETSPKGKRKIFDSIKLAIGLFCYGTYSYKDLFINFLSKKHGIKPSSVERIDLDTEKLRVWVNGEPKLEVHRHQLRPYLRKSCKNCQDFTNRLADISLGGVGSHSKWTTVLIRTQRGEEIFQNAQKEGYLRVKPLSDDGIEKIRALAILKLQEGVNK
jgi:coenzyme F420-reducing hydrogenase beta subunit